MTALPKALAALTCVTLIAAAALPARAADQQVQLPYVQPDKDGNQWMVHYYGYLQQQGNMPVYSNAGVLTINGASTQGRMQRQAKLDGRTGELVLENLPIGGMSVTRRFQFNKDEGYVRMIDVIRNTQGRDVQANIVVNANANYGIQSGQSVADPKKKGQNTAWLGQTSANNKVVVEMYNGVGAKQPMSVNYQEGNSQVAGNLAVTIPANKEVAIMHVHAVANSMNEAQEFVKRFKDSKALKDLSPQIRKALVNFNAGASFAGDYEILRGDQTDVVETRGGDQFRGTLKAKTYKIATFYGPVDVPAEKVISIISLGAIRARQLLFTVDGDVFGGTLDGDKLALELSDGQQMEIPLTQVARAGYRKRPGEPEDVAADKPYVLMRTGERVLIAMPTDPVTVHTRFGAMKLKPESLTALVFQNEDHAIHEAHLTDGTRLAGVVESGQFSAKLAGGDQAIQFPLSSAARIQFRPDPADAVAGAGGAGAAAQQHDDGGAPQLRLTNEEVLVGALTGKLKLDTGFSMLTLDAAGIKTLTRIKDAPQDVQVALWDETSFRGQLQEPDLTCLTKSGIEVKVPVALVEDYTQPAPKPGGNTVNKIKDLINQLNADDWTARQKAQEQLITMGTAAVGVLKEMRPTQPEEAQSRIDQILAAIDKKK